MDLAIFSAAIAGLLRLVVFSISNNIDNSVQSQQNYYYAVSPSHHRLNLQYTNERPCRTSRSYCDVRPYAKRCPDWRNRSSALHTTCSDPSSVFKNKPPMKIFNKPAKSGNQVKSKKRGTRGGRRKQKKIKVIVSNRFDDTIITERPTRNRTLRTIKIISKILLIVALKN